MGALQTFHWGALYPDMVKRIAPFCSSAKCSRHNCVFLEGVRAALTCDAAYNGGWYRSRPRKACGRWRASMPAGDRPSIANGSTSSVWGYSSLEDFLVAYWENFFLPKDVNNLLTMLWTWQHGDISDNELYRGDFKKGIGSHQGESLRDAGADRSLLCTGRRPVRVANMPNAKFLPFPSIWGHFRRRAGDESVRRQVPRHRAERVVGLVIDRTRSGHFLGRGPFAATTPIIRRAGLCSCNVICATAVANRTAQFVAYSSLCLMLATQLNFSPAGPICSGLRNRATAFTPSAAKCS